MADGGGAGAPAAAPGSPSGLSGAFGSDAAAAAAAGGGAGGGATLFVLDVKAKLAAGAVPLGPAGLAFLGALGGALVAVARDGRARALREAPLSTQLDALVRRGLHKLAADLAAARGADAATLAGVRQRWGDHLYARGEFDAAAAQYLGTLGHLEPSYVIRR